MSRRSILASAALAVMCASALPLLAAPKPRVPVKPKPRVLLGTKQLSGDQAVLGREFTLGKSWPMNFQLNSVEYSTSRIRVGDRIFIPEGSEKYLVLHYTLHNPNPREATVRGDTFRFTAVDSTDTNMESRSWVGVENTRDVLNLRLKPGQKMNAYTFIPVPATASVPKLIVKSSDNLVLRYDLAGKIKPLTGPAVSPDDRSGVTALAVAPGQVGTTYQIGAFDVTVTGITAVPTSFGNQRLKEGERNLLVTMKVTNADQRNLPLRFDTLWVQATDADGAQVRARRNLLSASRDADFQSQLTPGQEVTVRTFITLEKGQTAKSLTLSAGPTHRAYRFEVNTTEA